MSIQRRIALGVVTAWLLTIGVGCLLQPVHAQPSTQISQSGTLTATSTSLCTSLIAGRPSMTADISNISGTITFQARGASLRTYQVTNTASGLAVTTTIANGLFRFDNPGLQAACLTVAGASTTISVVWTTGATSGGGAGGGGGGAAGAVTSVDGGLVTVGTTTDPKVVTDATGTLQQYLRGLVSMVAAGISTTVSNTVTVGAHALSAGSALIGKVGIDQTTPGTTDSVSVATGQGAGATIGVMGGAKVITDAAGTLQQYARGLVSLLAAGINVAVTNGSTTDTDDGTVAAGQAALALVISAGYEYDGTNWTRPRGPNTVAHATTDAGNPLLGGFHATAGLTGVTLTTAGQRSYAVGETDGVPIFRPWALEDLTAGSNTNTDGTSTSLIAAAGSGVKTYITGFTCINTHASTDGYVELKDNTTVRYRLPLPHAAGAVAAALGSPIPGTANTAWNTQTSAAITTVLCSATGFKSKI